MDSKDRDAKKPLSLSRLKDGMGTSQRPGDVAPAPDRKVIEKRQLDRSPEGDPTDDDQALA